VNNAAPEALKDMTDRASSPTPRARARHDAGSRLVTARDRELLAFVAEHRFVLAAHAQTLLGVGERVTSRRLGGLTARGLLEHTRMLHAQPAWYRITRAGLAMIDSDLPPPRIDLRSYEHDIGVAWLWLAASRGGFGNAERVVSEREMRSRDAVRLAADRAAARGEARGDIEAAREPLFGVRLGGFGPGGLIRLHYPDLLLIGPRHDRLAIELELSSKGQRRRETILAGYGTEPSVAAVLYLADSLTIRRAVQSSAARLGLAGLVRVEQLRTSRKARSAGAPERARHPVARAPEHVRQRGAIGPASARHPAAIATPRAHGPAPPAHDRTSRVVLAR
jgi:hypothetical protein